MSVYVAIRGNKFGSDCPICLDPVEEKNGIAHLNGGDKHPLHRLCAKDIFSRLASNCPNCRTLVDTSSILTLKDKIIIFVKPLAKDAIFGALIGIVFSAQIFASEIQKKINTLQPEHSAIDLNAFVFESLKIEKSLGTFILAGGITCAEILASDNVPPAIISAIGSLNFGFTLENGMFRYVGTGVCTSFIALLSFFKKQKTTNKDLLGLFLIGLTMASLISSLGVGVFQNTLRLSVFTATSATVCGLLARKINQIG